MPRRQARERPLAGVPSRFGLPDTAFAFEQPLRLAWKGEARATTTSGALRIRSEVELPAACTPPMRVKIRASAG